MNNLHFTFLQLLQISFYSVLLLWFPVILWNFALMCRVLPLSSPVVWFPAPFLCSPECCLLVSPCVYKVCVFPEVFVRSSCVTHLSFTWASPELHLSFPWACSHVFQVLPVCVFICYLLGGFLFKRFVLLLCIFEFYTLWILNNCFMDFSLRSLKLTLCSLSCLSCVSVFVSSPL